MRLEATQNPSATDLRPVIELLERHVVDALALPGEIALDDAIASCSTRSELEIRMSYYFAQTLSTSFDDAVDRTTAALP